MLIVGFFMMFFHSVYSAHRKQSKAGDAEVPFYPHHGEAEEALWKGGGRGGAAAYGGQDGGGQRGGNHP